MVSRKRRTAPAPCLVAFPNRKSVSTFPGNALEPFTVSRNRRTAPALCPVAFPNRKSVSTFPGNALEPFTVSRNRRTAPAPCLVAFPNRKNVHFSWKRSGAVHGFTESSNGSSSLFVAFPNRKSVSTFPGNALADTVEDRHIVGDSRPSHVEDAAQTGIRHLDAARFAGELHGGQHMHRNARRADRMAL